MRTLFAVVFVLCISDLQIKLFSEMSETLFSVLVGGSALLLYYFYLYLTRHLFEEQIDAGIVNDVLVFKKKNTTKEIEISKIKFVSLQQRDFFGETYLIFACKTKENQKYKLLTTDIKDMKMFIR